MKHKQNSHIKRSRVATSRKRSIRRQPLHKRVLLHPFSAFVMLCVGVLTIGSTFHGRAASYDVTAKVSALPITVRPVIAVPDDGQHVATDETTIQGTCAPKSYVKLYVSALYGGSSVCSGGHFNLRIPLLTGGNQLQARIFNLTDDEGPASTPITVYRDVPGTIPAPQVAPASLRVADLEDGAYKQGTMQTVSDRPTVSGYAPPFSDVTVTFHSDPVTCKTKADARGVWSCTLATSLPPGMHQVFVTAMTQLGEKLVLPAFQIAVAPAVEPFWISSDYKYKVYTQGQSASWSVALNGGTAPFELLVDWGDGSTSKVDRPDRSQFDLEHAYDSKALADTDYTVSIRATDARGATTVQQFSATVKGIAVPTVATQSTWAAISGGIRQWLWVIWPAYGAVVLMALSFWIGEREAYRRFVASRRTRKLHAHARGGR